MTRVERKYKCWCKMSLKFIIYIYFLAFFSTDVKSQKLFLRTNFKGNDWGKLIYKSFDLNIRTKVECLGLCLQDSANCNVGFFFEQFKSCFIGTMASNYSVITTTSQNVNGYVDIGISIYLSVCFSIYMYLYLCVSLSMYISVYVYLCLCVSLSMCISIYVYLYICVSLSMCISV